jgi:hypothetical protein
LELSQETEAQVPPADWSLIISISSMTVAFLLLFIMLCLLRRSARDEEARELALQLPGKQGFLGTMAIDQD